MLARSVTVGSEEFQPVADSVVSVEATSAGVCPVDRKSGRKQGFSGCV